jgi:hypothetical protein
MDIHEQIRKEWDLLTSAAYRRGLRFCQTAFLCGVSTLVITSAFLLGQSPLTTTVPERIAVTERDVTVASINLVRLQDDVAKLQSTVATMQGFGIGAGSILGVLQVLQIVLGRRREGDS